MSDVMLRVLGPLHEVLKDSEVSLEDMDAGLPCEADDLRGNRGRMLFSIPESHFEDLPDGTVRETIRIPPPYRDSPEFFHLMKGSLEASDESSQGDALELEPLCVAGKREGPPDRVLNLATSENEIGVLNLWNPKDLNSDGQIDGLTELSAWISIALDKARSHAVQRDLALRLEAQVKQKELDLIVANDSLAISIASSRRRT